MQNTDFCTPPPPGVDPPAFAAARGEVVDCGWEVGHGLRSDAGEEHAMAGIVTGRSTSEAPEGTVVFLIGMRVNRPWKPHRWLPVARQMPRMLQELAKAPELGLLHASSFLSGLTVLTVQYWESAAKLEAYATARDQAHLPAWREFNRRIKNNGDVGVFHETYVLGTHETVYVNMPTGFGLAGATRSVPVAARGQRAMHRLDPSVPDTPVVDPY